MNLRTTQGLSFQRKLMRMLGLSLVFCIISLAAFAQTAKAEGKGRVEGIVSNVATGDPVRGAKVDLCDASNDKVVPLCLQTDTDSEGRFVFTGRPAGHYTVQGEAPGFLPDSIVLNGRGSREFDLAAGSVRTVHLRLWPEGTISGRIVDEEGRPMSGVSVAAIGEEYGFGRRSLWRYQHWGGPSEALTDKDGKFRIGALKPGSYFIEAFFDFPHKHDVATVRKGYLPVYYPSAAFLSSATPVCVGAGQQVQVDFGLSPRATYHASARLILPAGFKRDFEPISGLRGEYGQLLTSWEEEYDHGSRTLVITGLAAGSYELDTATGIYPTDLAGRLRFTVTDKDLDGMVLTLQEPVALHISVHLPNGFRPSTAYSLRLRLQPDGEAMDGIDDSGWPITTGGELPHRALPPGHYKLFLFGEDALYLKSARFGQQDVLAQGLALEETPTEALVVTLERATGDVRGNVISASAAPVSAADVKLISQGEDSRYVVRSTSTDRNGDFDFAGVPPGSYDVVALSEATRDWEFGPEEWATVKAFAKHVEVADSTHTILELHATTIACDASPCIAARP
ncbi:MAG: carboxypeptidase regulatory-like domain-containing protein [Candidatus Acidiferrales bacterium]